MVSLDVRGIVGDPRAGATIFLSEDATEALSLCLESATLGEPTQEVGGVSSVVLRGAVSGLPQGGYVWATPAITPDVPAFPVRVAPLCMTEALLPRIELAKKLERYQSGPISCWVSPCAANNLSVQGCTLRLLSGSAPRQSVAVAAEIVLEVAEAKQAGSAESLLGTFEVKRLVRWLSPPARSRLAGHVWSRGMILNIRLGAVDFTLRVRTIELANKDEKQTPPKTEEGAGVKLCWAEGEAVAGLADVSSRVAVEEGVADNASSLASDLEGLRVADHSTLRHGTDKHSGGACQACAWARQAGECVGGLGEELSRVAHAMQAALGGEGATTEGMCGMVVSGPPGVGKTAMIRSLLAASPFAFVERNGTDLFGSERGATEDRVRCVFGAARRLAPSILFIDDIDAIAAAATNKSEVERRGVVCLLACLDALREASARVFVMAATDRIHAVDTAVLAAGRLGMWVRLQVPRAEERREILKVLGRGVGGGGELEEVVRRGHGYTAADMKLVLAKALGAAAGRRGREGVEGFGREDLVEAMREVEPAAVRGRRRAHDDDALQWSQLYGVDQVKRELERCVVGALRRRAAFERLGVQPPRGVLLYGPAGTGKTAVAVALGEEVAELANFVRVDGTEVVSAAVGASERAIATLFQQARACSPCLLFLDDVDALFPPRSGPAADNNALDRVLSQFLIELDGINTDPRRPVMLVAASSRPRAIDPAILRPGRLEHHVLVPPPDAAGRLSLLRHRLREGMDCEAEVTSDAALEQLVQDTQGFSVADLISLCREAAMSCIRRQIAGGGYRQVSLTDIQHALALVPPSLAAAVIQHPPRPWQLSAGEQ